MLSPSYSRLAVLALFAALVSPGHAADSSSPNLRSLAGPPFDQAFLRQMIDQQHQAVELAKLAALNAQRDAVKQFAVEASAREQKDLADLETLRTGAVSTANRPGEAAPVDPSAAPTAVPPAPRMVEIAPGQDSPEARQFHELVQRLSGLSGEAFDREFVREMLRHHTDTLEMAQLARDKGSARAVRERASEIAQEQSDEIQELQRLRSQLAEGRSARAASR